MAKKKIGILTFHFTDNPGSVLQAYALQQILFNMGADAEIINYQRRGAKNKRYEIYIKPIKKYVGGLWVLTIPFLVMAVKMKYRKYDFFRKKNMKILPTRPISSFNKLQEIERKYDKFIVGSDQVWNFDNVKVDNTFLLDFVAESDKKIAYAVSFGKTDFQKCEAENIAERIKSFEYLSLREIQGVELVWDLARRKADLVLDPTLLLKREEWMRIAVKPRIHGYILVYLRARSDLIIRLAESLSKKMSLPIVQITPLMRSRNVGKRVICPGPKEWLGYFLNASYVITNSFHGIVFSLNFGKQFFAAPLDDKEGNTNSRIYSILEQFGLQERMLTEKCSLEEIPDINYEKINRLILRKKRESLRYLHSAIFGKEHRGEKYESDTDII